MNELDSIVASAAQAFGTAATPADLENAKAQYLGKAGRITELMKGLGGLSVDEKKARGAAINQAKSTEGPKIKAALEDLQAPVDGVVTSYNKPFTPKDHDAITANIPVFGEVKGQKVVYAYPDDQKKASEVRVKDVNAKGALPAKK